MLQSISKWNTYFFVNKKKDTIYYRIPDISNFEFQISIIRVILVTINQNQSHPLAVIKSIIVLNASFRAEIYNKNKSKLKINKNKYDTTIDIDVGKDYTMKKTCSISSFLRVFAWVRFYCLAHAKAVFITISSFFGTFAFSTEKTNRLHPPFVRCKKLCDCATMQLSPSLTRVNVSVLYHSSLVRKS